FAGDPNLTDEQRRQVETEEAWTLGVIAPKRLVNSRKLAPRPDPLPAGGERENAASTETLAPLAGRGRGPRKAREGEGQQPRYIYLRDPAAIYRRSFAAIGAEADLARFPPA